MKNADEERRERERKDTPVMWRRRHHSSESPASSSESPASSSEPPASSSEPPASSSE